MTLLKTSALNGVAVLIKMISLFGINKFLAMTAGPSGYAIVGQFQNLIQMLTTFSSGAVTTGVTKYTAEKVSDTDFIHSLWKTAGSISLIGSLIGAFIISLFSKDLSLYFLNDIQYQNVFYWLAASLSFAVVNSLFLAIINGMKAIKIYVLANIFGSIFSILSVYFLSSALGLEGALIALAIYQSLSFIVTLFLISRQPWFKLTYICGKLEKKHIFSLLNFTLISLVSAVSVPFSQLVTRGFIIDFLSIETAGEWEAMVRMSSGYLMFLTSTLSVYFLPRIAEIRTKEDTKIEINYFFKHLIPVLILLFIIIYFFRLQLISILFSDQFSTIENLVGIHLFGDFFKMIGWAFGYVLIARGLTKEFVFSEMLFSILFIFLSLGLVKKLGLVGMAYSHLINYLFYTLYLFYRLRVKEVV